MLSLSLNWKTLRKCLVVVHHQGSWWCVLPNSRDFATIIVLLGRRTVWSDGRACASCWNLTLRCSRRCRSKALWADLLSLCADTSLFVWCKSVSYSCINNDLIVLYQSTFHLMSYWQRESYLFDVLKWVSIQNHKPNVVFDLPKNPLFGFLKDWPLVVILNFSEGMMVYRSR